MARLILDKIPELMEADGKKLEYRPAKDGKEFYTLLQRKMINDIKQISVEDTVEGKAKRIIDLDLATQEFSMAIEGYGQLYEERLQKVGSYSKRLVAEVEHVVEEVEDVSPILTWAKEKGWPETPVSSYARIPEGEEAWRKALAFPGVAHVIAKKINDESQ